MKFYVWKFYVGDEGTTSALVKNIMDIMEQQGGGMSTQNEIDIPYLSTT